MTGTKKELAVGEDFLEGDVRPESRERVLAVELKRHGQKQIFFYVFGAVLTILALLLTEKVEAFRNKQSFLPVTAAITITAWYAGLGPSLVAILIASVGWAWWIAPPVDSIRVQSVSDLARLFLFVLIALLISSLHAARENAEIALRQAQHRLTLALEAARMGVWDYDIRKGVFWLSPRMRAIFSADDDEETTTYAGFLAHVHPDDRGRVVRTMTGTVVDKLIYEVVYRVQLPDGGSRTVMTRGRTLLNEHGEAERMVGVVIEVAGRKLETSVDHSHA